MFIEILISIFSIILGAGITAWLNEIKQKNSLTIELLHKYRDFYKRKNRDKYTINSNNKVIHTTEEKLYKEFTDEDHNKICDELAYFELIGLMYRHNFINKKIIHEALLYLTQAYGGHKNYIEWNRKKSGQGKAWSNYEYLYNQIKNKQTKKNR